MNPLAKAFARMPPLPVPLVFVDNEHVVRYHNRAATEAYCVKRGWESLVGRSLFACHHPSSREKIIALHQRLLEGEEEIPLYLNAQGEQVTLVAVRADDGELIGYYERFTPGG